MITHLFYTSNSSRRLYAHPLFYHSHRSYVLRVRIAFNRSPGDLCEVRHGRGGHCRIEWGAHFRAKFPEKARVPGCPQQEDQCCEEEEEGKLTFKINVIASVINFVFTFVAKGGSSSRRCRRKKPESRSSGRRRR